MVSNSKQQRWRLGWVEEGAYHLDGVFWVTGYVVCIEWLLGASALSCFGIVKRRMVIVDAWRELGMTVELGKAPELYGSCRLQTGCVCCRLAPIGQP